MSFLSTSSSQPVLVAEPKGTNGSTIVLSPVDDDESNVRSSSSKSRDAFHARHSSNNEDEDQKKRKDELQNKHKKDKEAIEMTNPNSPSINNSKEKDAININKNHQGATQQLIISTPSQTTNVLSSSMSGTNEMYVASNNKRNSKKQGTTKKSIVLSSPPSTTFVLSSLISSTNERDLDTEREETRQARIRKRSSHRSRIFLSLLAKSKPSKKEQWLLSAVREEEQQHQYQYHSILWSSRNEDNDGKMEMVFYDNGRVSA